MRCHDDDSPEDEPLDRFILRPRHTRRQTADRAIEGNPLALAVRELTRASYYPGRIKRNNPHRDRQIGYMRRHIDNARRLRTFIGPPCPDDMIPF